MFSVFDRDTQDISEYFAGVMIKEAGESEYAEYNHY